MKDFISRIVTFEGTSEHADCDGEQHRIAVTRSRDSYGYCSIVAMFGGQRVEFSGELGDYVGAAREFASLIEQACDHHCDLPKV